MKLSKLFMVLSAVAALSFSAHAAISVGPSGAGPLTFDSTPEATEFSTGVLTGTGTTFTDAAGIDAAVAAVSAANIVRLLPTSTTVPPTVFSGGMRHNNGTGGFYLQSRPTTEGTNAAGMLLATFQNNTGAALASFGINYDFNSFNPLAGEAPGFQVYFSANGTPGSWQKLSALSGIETIGVQSDTIIGSVANGATFYILWVDDNANGITDPSYTIDNLSITLAGPVVRITSPGNGANIAFGTPITINADAAMFPGTITGVQFFQNGTSLGTDASAPYSFVFNNASMGAHDLTAIARDNLGNSRTSSVVRVTVVPNTAPVVAITAPTADEMLVSSNVFIHATATDTDGSVTQVQFRDGNTAIGAPDTTVPYSFNYRPVSAGVHTITAVATDNLGLLSTSAPVRITVVQPLNSLVPWGGTWKYLDDGSDQGNQWFLADDSAWASGPAELGYGDDDEATIVSFGGVAAAKHITTYFKYHFNVANPVSITSLAIRMRVDDGAVVYLNGQPVWIENLTNDLNEIFFNTLALAAIEDDLVLGTNLVVGQDIGQLNAGENVIAVEVHQASAGSSDISFDLEVIANPGVNRPVVSILTPTNNQAFVAPDQVNVTASAMDKDGGVVSLEFFVDGVSVGTDAAPPYANGAASTAGTHVISVVATDNSSLTSTASVTIVVSAGPVFSTLVNSNSTWVYLDNGTDQGTAWQGLAFDVSTWKTGTAELGYGDGDEVTVVEDNATPGYVAADTDRYITTYFRKTFNVTAAGNLTNLIVSLKRDDGGVVYINGVEVFRDNMPAGPIDYLTPGGAAIVSETAFFSTNVSPGILFEGQNVVAVEIHQSGPTSSDISFDLQLQSVAPPGPARPKLTITLVSPTSVTISWTPATPGYRLVQSTSVTGTYTTSPSQVNGQTVTPLPGLARFYKLQNP